MTTYGQAWFEADPALEVRKLEREMRHLLNSYLRTGTGFPAVNVWNNAEQAVVEAEIPGVDPAKIGISVEGERLTLTGERPEPERNEGEFHRRERVTGTFSRVIRLPYEIEGGRVTASAKNGVLTVTLPRRESTKPRKITVTTVS